MEQFKIDVSKCTDEEKREIQERLFEMGYNDFIECDRPYASIWDTIYACPDGTLQADNKNHDQITYWNGRSFPERPASDFLKPRFQTRPHEYTGCNADIAAALKRLEWIYCSVWDGSDKLHARHGVWVMAYRTGLLYCYICYHGKSYEHAEPIPAEPAKKTVTLELTDEQIAKVKEMIDGNNS